MYKPFFDRFMVNASTLPLFVVLQRTLKYTMMYIYETCYFMSMDEEEFEAFVVRGRAHPQRWKQLKATRTDVMSASVPRIRITKEECSRRYVSSYCAKGVLYTASSCLYPNRKAYCTMSSHDDIILPVFRKFFQHSILFTSVVQPTLASTKFLGEVLKLETSEQDVLVHLRITRL